MGKIKFKHQTTVWYNTKDEKNAITIGFETKRELERFEKMNKIITLTRVS